VGRLLVIARSETDEAIHELPVLPMDGFAALAMTIRKSLSLPAARARKKIPAASGGREL
jgi:hypothetical protein